MKDKKNSGFKVPEGYFESFGEKLSEKIREPGSFLPSQEGFSVPEGYFETFNEKLAKRIDLPEAKVITLYQYKKHLWAAASVAAIVAFFLLMPGNTAGDLTFDDLAGTEIALYMENNELELTDDEIAQMVPVEDLEMSDMMDNQLEEDNIMEYLDSSVEDYDELNIEPDE